MSIVIDPSWSFEQALKAAWKEYFSPGMQFGVTNRIRFLVQWANVVGQSKARRELEEAERRGLLKEFSITRAASCARRSRGCPGSRRGNRHATFAERFGG